MAEKTLVQNTNLSCVVSKWSASEQGYFVDCYLKHMTRKLQKRSPLINRGYYIRAKAIDLNLKKALLKVSEIKCQIVSLGAGFDTTFFRLKSDGLLPSDSRYFEIDFKSVLKQKFNYIKDHAELCGLLENMSSDCKKNVVLTSDQLILVGGDLYNLDELEADLLSAELDFSIPTIFLSECVLNYMQTNRADDIIKWAAQKFSSGFFIMYEQVCPKDGFGQIMKNHFSRIGSPLLSINSYPDIQSQRQRFTQLGWQDVEVEDLNTIHRNLGYTELLRISNLESFDEFEEYHMKCSHYILATGKNGLFLDQTVATPGPACCFANQNEGQVSWEMIICSVVSRFGHAAVQLNKNEVFLSGGFGYHETGHRRLTGLTLVQLSSGQHEHVLLEDPHNLLGERLFHVMILLSCKNCLLVIGGRSSPGKALKNPIVLLKREEKQPENDFFEDVCSQHRHLHSEDNNKVFFNTATSQIDAYLDRSNRLNMDDALSRWTVGTLSMTGKLPEPLWRHSATSFVNGKGEEKILVFGGYNHKKETLGYTYLLNVKTMHWSQLEILEEHPGPRHSHSCVLWNNHVVLSGGLSDKHEALNDIHMFDVRNETWSQYFFQDSIIPRFSHTSYVWNDCLHLIGGASTSCIQNGSPGIAQVYLKTNRSLEISLKVPKNSQPVLFFKHQSFLNEHDGSVWIVGGGGNCFSFGTAFNKDIVKLEIK